MDNNKNCCEASITTKGQAPLVERTSFSNKICIYNENTKSYEQYYKYLTHKIDNTLTEYYLLDNVGLSLTGLPAGKIVPCAENVHVVNSSGKLIETLDCDNEPSLKVFDKCTTTAVNAVNTSVQATITAVNAVNTSVQATITAVNATTNSIDSQTPILTQIRDNVAEPANKIIENRVSVPPSTSTLVLEAYNRRSAVITWVSSSDRNEPLYVGFLGAANPETAMTVRYGQPIQIEGYMTKKEVHVWSRAELVLSTVEFLD